MHALTFSVGYLLQSSKAGLLGPWTFLGLCLLHFSSRFTVFNLQSSNICKRFSYPVQSGLLIIFSYVTLIWTKSWKASTKAGCVWIELTTKRDSSALDRWGCAQLSSVTACQHHGFDQVILRCQCMQGQVSEWAQNKDEQQAKQRLSCRRLCVHSTRSQTSVLETRSLVLVSILWRLSAEIDWRGL